MWNGFAKFRGGSDIKTWIWRVSLNTCITAERKKRKLGERVPLSMEINLFEDSDDDSRQIRMLRERIDRLGYFDRAIILLWLENLCYEEIGSIMGISAKNVSVRLVRIREQLKKIANE
jgi:RNA polymerase sigma-70 factor (ECF subfamily)